MCEYCDHETNEEAKRFPLFNENAKREEAFIDEDDPPPTFERTTQAPFPY